MNRKAENAKEKERDQNQRLQLKNLLLKEQKPSEIQNTKDKKGFRRNWFAVFCRVLMATGPAKHSTLRKNYDKTHRDGRFCTKETLKELCASRIRERRNELFKLSRDNGEEFLKNIVTQTCRELDFDEPTQLEELGLVTYLKQLLHEELIFEESLMLSNDTTTTSQTPCPICGKIIRINKSVIFCNCGLRITSLPGENLTLDNLKQACADSVEEHRKSSNCTHALEFKQSEAFLCSFCKNCNFEAIVL